jgi:hypothetical protein
MTISPAARKAGHDAAASPLSGAALDLTPADSIDRAMEGAAPVIAAEAAAAERESLLGLLARFRERMIFAAGAADPIPYPVEAVPWAKVLEVLALAGGGRAEKGDSLAGH